MARRHPADRIRDLSQPVLVGYVVVLVTIPSELIIGPLGAAGTPAGVVAVLMMLWWTASVAVAPPSTSRTNPVKWLVLAFAGALVVSYLVGMSRPVVTGEEVSSADRALLALAGWCGAALVLIDGTSTRRRLDTVLQTLTLGVGVIALLGMLQFFFNLDLAHFIRIPGLTANGSFGELIARSNFRRVTGTTAHPIEFGVVLAAVIPLTIHYGRFADRSRVRAWCWVACGLMAAAIPLSVAKSGIIGAAVALAVMFFTWPREMRVRVVAALGVGMVACSFVVPGLLGTFKSLFLNAGSDPSTGGRTDDYAPVMEYVVQNPLFGRGFGTFIPSLYRTLDNQYLGLLVEAGILGLAATLALLLGTACVGQVIRHHSRSERDRDLAQSLVAGLLVMAVDAVTFDLFGFSMCVGILFLLIGALGALRATTSPTRVTPRRLSRRAAAAVVAVGLVTTVGSLALAKLSPPEYHALGTVILVPPSLPATLGVSASGRASTATNVLLRVVESPESRATLKAQGVESFDMAVGDGSLMMGTDRIGSGGSVITVLSRGSTAAGAEAGLTRVVAALQTQLVRLQTSAGAGARASMYLQELTTNPAFPVKGRPSRTAAGGLLLALLLGSGTVNVLRRRRPVRPRPTVPAGSGSVRDPRVSLVR